MSTMNSAVLLLNSTYEPLSIINVKRALRLMLTDKGYTVESNGQVLKAAKREWPLPLVVRLSYFVKRPHQRVKFTKQAVMVRDHYTCQYCGVRSRELTLDHVAPRHAGGETVWTNVVAACKGCNADKGGKTLKESGLKLKNVPREPRFLPYIRAVNRNQYQMVWEKYLFSDPDTPYLVRGPIPTGYDV